ncbi:TetR family transcriptional regulator [Cryobacterium roopkundense]|uniref:AcrR family transcriptional regulator n=1 Tax=Cryobacterium roopkundense TaxID=1001240 RepID=A0A099JGI8_9MICO|nr:TetR/AcrR family transcriptional regulator [Cryobacterium roopkundense]KGJ77569.1 TetR family transcriptional regulator [Cryobacterium roopkundense]MBB5641717.1 AcrR family transcriptional regulator [Cryobacterium roopkundense]
MGRIQSFDADTVVRAARDLFWDRGYDRASLSDLEGATGLNRSSLYNAFGNKRGLFDAAVQDYLDSVIRPRLAVLQSAAPNESALLEYFEGLRRTVATLPKDSPRRGCLLVNCAAGLAGHDDPTRAVIEDYRAELAAALRFAIVSAGLGAEADPAALEARVRTLASLSVSAMLISRVNRDEAVALLATAGAHINEWVGPRA